ncbi:uncharacterized protein [Physcomitrium patens]|uniref:Uncharacterized protein n=2 Tax=Physcomitrium patens TaxID=3218 RepID=A0A7I4AIX9_PHYPA|nr:uncharacterized protein LOC112290182 isoform X4 [Physcomitrium patens]|eukprot:XP_024391979.1 uncharacterized protein LOC112290182 isoform X4 [Physcomitrella patens]
MDFCVETLIIANDLNAFYVTMRTLRTSCCAPQATAQPQRPRAESSTSSMATTDRLPAAISSSRSPRWMKKKIDRGIAPPTFAVDETSLDEVKVKIKVGPLSSLQERVYRFQKIFGSSSRLVVITLPKPLGIVFVESPLVDAYGKNRVMVGELVVGGNADRASRVAQLFDGRKNVASNTPILNGGVMPGDILRATTTVGVTVDFFGIRRPQRVMDLFVADGRPWHLITRALNASFVADGELTLVLERRNAYF